MQLRVARLCLDCEEIHDEQTCPICRSGSFAYITRWVPAPDRRVQPRPAPSNETAETFRQLLEVDRKPSGVKRWMTPGALGLAAVAVAGWAWSRKGTPRESPSAGDGEARKLPLGRPNE
jgi:hypothetical protein